MYNSSFDVSLSVGVFGWSSIFLFVLVWIEWILWCSCDWISKNEIDKDFGGDFYDICEIGVVLVMSSLEKAVVMIFDCEFN